MCHFITLIAPTDDAASLRCVMDAHNREATPLDNPSIREKLYDGEYQFLTTRKLCDCGTVLAPYDPTGEIADRQLNASIAGMKQKGWSQSKIERAVQDKRKASLKPKNGDIDSIELWVAVLQDLREELQLPYAGLFVGYYSKQIETEKFSVSRRRLPKSVDLKDALSLFRPNEITIFQMI